MFPIMRIADDGTRPDTNHVRSPCVRPITSITDDGTPTRHEPCLVAVCSPSRASLMTGRRPDTSLLSGHRVFPITSITDDGTPTRHEPCQVTVCSPSCASLMTGHGQTRIMSGRRVFGPSRASLMTGRRPDTNHVWSPCVPHHEHH